MPVLTVERTPRTRLNPFDNTSETVHDVVALLDGEALLGEIYVFDELTTDADVIAAVQADLVKKGLL